MLPPTMNPSLTRQDQPTSHSRATERSPAAQAGATHDADLVQRFKAGDEAAFLEIMQRYQAKILTITQGLLHNHADAEEITQDTFIRAHRNLGGFRGDSSLATWLHRIAVNLARNRYWYFFRRRRHATLSLDCPIGEEGDATLSDLIATDAPDPARVSTREEFSALVSECMGRLEPHHREILVLRNTHNLSYDEIAGRLGINAGTVKSRIARARESLRAKLAATCPEFAPDADPSDWFEPARHPGRLAPAWA
jgi:RNA polymerase sigma-70 factor (ECF subfamily)